MIIDIHAHLWLGREEENKKTLVETAKRCGIDRVYVSTLNAHVPDQEEIRLANEATAKLIQENPALFGGAVYVNPDHDNTDEVMRKGVEEQGMEMVKVWVSTFADTPAMFRMAEGAMDLNVPLLIHAMHKATGQLTFENTGEQVAVLAKRYPNLSILMAHMGGNVYQGLTAIRPYENVSVDISMSIVRGDDFSYCLEQLGAKRILFGTDMPGVGYQRKISQVEEANLSQEEKDLVYYKNALRLLHREDLS